jgi:hypothetical protein
MANARILPFFACDVSAATGGKKSTSMRPAISSGMNWAAPL